MSPDPSTARSTVYRARRALIGNGQRIDDAAILVQDGLIRAIGEAAQIGQPSHATVVDLGTDTILPGLIDTHQHISFSGDQRLIEHITQRDTEAMMAVGRLAADDLLGAGITTVRDLGALGDVAFRLAREVTEGRINGPEIVASTAQLTTPGGPNAFLGGGCADLSTLR